MPKGKRSSSTSEGLAEAEEAKEEEEAEEAEEEEEKEGETTTDTVTTVTIRTKAPKSLTEFQALTNAEKNLYGKPMTEAGRPHPVAGPGEKQA